MYLFAFGFNKFLVFFHFVKFAILASRFWKSLLISTRSSWAFSWVFCMLFSVIWISLEFTFIDFITGICSLLYCLVFCGNQAFEFYCNSADWLPHDARSGREESRKRLLTVLYPFFFCLLVLYIYIAPSQVIFEFVSGELFRWYLLILIGLLTCVELHFIFIAFNWNVIGCLKKCLFEYKLIWHFHTKAYNVDLCIDYVTICIDYVLIYVSICIDSVRYKRD